jgi:effector-binding domain-containing protein
VYQGILDWSYHLAQPAYTSFKVKQKEPYSYIEEEFTVDGSTYEVLWELENVNAVTSVTFSVKEKGKSFYNRLTAPFVETAFKKTQIKNTLAFKKELEKHLENFIIEVDGEATSPAAFVAYISLASVMAEKGQTMIMNNSKVTLFLNEHGIEMAGKPFLEVTKWNVDSEALQYNFCFPIDKTDSLPQSDLIHYKTLPEKKCIKATYHGDYRTSDRAWFALYDYAKQQNIAIDLLPTEHFFNNPHHGGKEINWKAEVFMPLEKQ